MSDLSGTLGDIFWDLPAAVSYPAGSELGCTIYVANPTDVPRDYCLIARLYSDSTLVSEEAITVYGHTWFTVDAGDFVSLHGAMRFEDSDVLLSLDLIERETGEVANSVKTNLISTYGVPANWPTGPTIAGMDLSSLMMLIMMIVIGTMAISNMSEEEEKPMETSSQKALPPGGY